MDRISSLPDEIVCHTLSFLSTKEAALTSVLSKRWRNLFAFSANLDLLDDKEEMRQSFMDFVDRLLAVSGSQYPIKKFTLKCRNGVVDSAHINRWIIDVLNRGVLDLDIDLAIDDAKDGYSLPNEIFSCKTVVTMKLTGFCVDVLPEDAFLPALKTLSLYSAKTFSFCLCILSGELLSVFPVHEKLVLHCVNGFTLVLLKNLHSGETERWLQ